MQIVGAILGSSFLFSTVPNSNSSALGSNSIAPGVSTGNAMMGEIVSAVAGWLRTVGLTAGDWHGRAGGLDFTRCLSVVLCGRS